MSNPQFMQMVMNPNVGLSDLP
jgi:ubiquilin